MLKICQFLNSFRNFKMVLVRDQSSAAVHMDLRLASLGQLVSVYMDLRLASLGQLVIVGHIWICSYQGLRLQGSIFFLFWHDITTQVSLFLPKKCHDFYGYSSVVLFSSKYDLLGQVTATMQKTTVCSLSRVCWH